MLFDTGAPITTMSVDNFEACGGQVPSRNPDTTVGGVHAIAIANSADLTHGLVLLNMAAGQTAANLLADHTTFSSGHMLIS